MLESHNLFFCLDVSILRKKSTVAWLLARYIVSPFKNDLASYLPYVAKLFKRSSVILCCATVYVSATGSSDVVVNRETVEWERERGRGIEEGGFKEVDWGEIACQALWKPQADWAGNQPTIPVQTSVLERSLCLLSLKSVSLFLWGEQDLDKQ